MGKLIITRFEDKLFSLYTGADGKPLELSVEDPQENGRLGNIYVGFVQQIVKNINAAFIEIAEKEVCYCSLKETTDYLFGPHGGSEKLCMGDYVLVQLEKETIKTKQASVTGKLQLTGKNLVLLHGVPGIRISNKITDKKEGARLKAILEPYTSEKYGFIVRTNAQNASEEALLAEASRLTEQYNEICTTGIHKAKGTLLYQNPPGYVDFLRDLPKQELDEVVTDDSVVYETLCSYCRDFQPEDLRKLRLYQDPGLSLFALYSFQKVIREATGRVVLLNSGASLVIEPTEALTVIDVNTGKAVSKKQAGDEVFYKINLEAARACIAQLRLRNLSGMILIDFINMKAQEYNDRLLSDLRELAKKDRIPVNVVDMTGLGLIELTRKKVKRPLHECLSQE